MPLKTSGRQGVTLMELMIAVALIGIGTLASAAAFKYIHTSIQYSKARTLAANVAQEKIQIIMQKSYYEVLVTSAPSFLTIGANTIAYDPGYFPPEILTEGGLTFTRYTYIQVVKENSGQIQLLPPDTPDTGLRQITETVVWNSDSGTKYVTIQSVLNNPNTVMANAILTGVVKDAVTSAGIPNALVVAAENIGWRDTTDAGGNYSINLSPGTFNFQASAAGYYSSIINLTIPTNVATNQPFSLTRISSGTVQGAAWFNNHLVISQVVASTGPANDIEYIELYNQTTAPMNIALDPPNFVPAIWPVVRTADLELARHLVFISTYVPALGFYLISNTNDGSNAVCRAFVAGGVSVQPDACWRYAEAPNHVLENALGSGTSGGPNSPDKGGIALANTSSIPPNPANRIDSIAWNGTSGPADPDYVESSALNPGAGVGLLPGETFVRRLDTTTAWNTGYGNSYDTGNNAVDFLDFSAPQFPPRTTSTTRSPMTGTPAAGSVVSIIDGLSVPSAAIQSGNPPIAQFGVPGVATGTWTVFVDSGSYSAEIDSVSVANSAVTVIPNAGTSPSGYYHTHLWSTGIVGMISGRVTNALNVPLSGIPISAGSYGTSTGANGTYYMRTTTGTYDVIANQGGTADSAYASFVQPVVVVSLGDVTANVNFSLSKGGKISGWISRDGINPLPGVAVVALDSNGSARDNEVSGTNGQFLLINLTTGTYTVQPVLDPKETSIPVTSTVTVNAGTTVSAGTFTVTGAMGSVAGSVTASSQPIRSGVLIVVTTTSMPSGPPALSSTTLTTSAYYSDSSLENGNYSVDVRGSTTTTYNVTAYYMRLANQTPVISTSTRTNITVTAGQVTSGVNFSW